ncbi:(3,5-dihydroxyphenyl)acetyl-CoA 1,2-dioxygenase DpgC [Streptomyces olivaceus]|uniref:(3,5-dihydroxyphenyl)acetyl-CoA 1,2-dioxygenase DpgC n=2 Tax=Streptomyces olivaceus TaxID=47716 RepID=UPI000A829030|nr:(3,5-dihydroxyphenyl)acetyl-CoA 1,2-dioxygenase DpgC [Streptomyces olivaceus]
MKTGPDRTGLPGELGILVRLDGGSPLPELTAALDAVCEQAGERGERTVVVLRFTPAPHQPREWPGGVSIQEVKRWERAVRRLERLDHVNIAVVEGTCGGPVLDLLLAADYRIAGPDLRLLLPVNEGHFWPGMTLYRLVQHIGLARARRIVLWDSAIELADATELGIVDQVSEDLTEAVHTAAPTGPAAPVPLSGRFDDDARRLAEQAVAAERILAALPPVPGRSRDERTRAATAHAEVRAVRRDFLARHTDTVYGLLTDGLTRRPRLPDLVDAVADRVPGLVPTRAQMAAELRFVQAEKEGREIDQGRFCGAVLRSPTAGRHLVETMLGPTPRALELLDRFRAEGRVELDAVHVERRGTAAHVEFRNPGRLNAENARLVADLDTAVDLVLLDDTVRVGVLRGGTTDHPAHRGRRVFSAGIDLTDLRDGRIPLVGFLLARELGYVNKLLHGLLTDPAPGAGSERYVTKPWIGAVDTFAIGGGMQLLLTLDHVVAEEGAYVSLPAAEEGIVPGAGNLRLTRQTGARLARQVVLGGRRIAATGPEAAAVYDEVVPADRMDEAVERAAAALAAPAVAANRRMLALAEEPLDHFRTYLAEFAFAQADRAYAPDVLDKVERRWQERERRRAARGSRT